MLVIVFQNAHAYLCDPRNCKMQSKFLNSNSQGIGLKFLYPRDQLEPLINFWNFFHKNSTAQKSYWGSLTPEFSLMMGHLWIYSILTLDIPVMWVLLQKASTILTDFRPVTWPVESCDLGKELTLELRLKFNRWILHHSTSRLFGYFKLLS